MTMPEEKVKLKRCEMTYAEFITAVESTDTPNWRKGQTYFNMLHRFRPALAERIRGTSLDPFHRDDRIPAFRVWLSDHWNGEAHPGSRSSG